jgi:hypothetical protein
VFLGSVGIILQKNRRSPFKVVILDKVHGKIECIANTPSLSVGALITYNIREQQSSRFISDTTLLYIPLSLAHIDMLFFHHVLELIYHFTQIGNYSDEIFDLMAFLYSAEHTTMTTQTKKFFLLKLLTSMGSMPELNTVRTEQITKLNTLAIQELSQMIINTTHEQELDRWLWSCIWQHPYVNEFKTVHFLAENRAS